MISTLQGMFPYMPVVGQLVFSFVLQAWSELHGFISLICWTFISFVVYSWRGRFTSYFSWMHSFGKIRLICCWFLLAPVLFSITNNICSCLQVLFLFFSFLCLIHLSCLIDTLLSDFLCLWDRDRIKLRIYPLQLWRCSGSLVVIFVEDAEYNASKHFA